MFFFLYCRHCHKHNTFLQAANKCDDAFTTRGFDNIKKACDLLIQELHDRFGQREVMKPIVTLESLLQELSDFNDSVYRQEFTVEKLEKQLGILVDVIHVELPEVKKVTSVRSICDALAKHANRNLLSEVHIHVSYFDCI